MASNAENVFIWWRHHGNPKFNGGLAKLPLKLRTDDWLHATESYGFNYWYYWSMFDIIWFNLKRCLWTMTALDADLLIIKRFIYLDVAADLFHIHIIHFKCCAIWYGYMFNGGCDWAVQVNTKLCKDCLPSLFINTFRVDDKTFAKWGFHILISISLWLYPLESLTDKFTTKQLKHTLIDTSTSSYDVRTMYSTECR